MYVSFYAYALLFVSLCKLLDTNKLLKYKYTIGTFKVYICIWERLKNPDSLPHLEMPKFLIVDFLILNLKTSLKKNSEC